MKVNRWRIRLTAVAAVLLAGSMLYARPETPADLVLLHGKIVTVDKNHPSAEALAVRGLGRGMCANAVDRAGRES